MTIIRNPDATQRDLLDEAADITVKVTSSASHLIFDEIGTIEKRTRFHQSFHEVEDERWKC
jgi:hypothetical protein